MLELSKVEIDAWDVEEKSLFKLFRA